MDTPPPPPCPLTTALDVIGGKWHLIVLYALAQQPRRFNELQRLAPGVSHKVLTQTLRHLETHGLIVRAVGTGPSPCVEYSLSERGETVRPILAAIVDWGLAHSAADLAAQRRNEGRHQLMQVESAAVRSTLA
jgi:DNA-binding HxlR family transcriptional regulator